MAERELLTHYDESLCPEPSRTVLKPFEPSDPPAFAQPGQSRIARIAERVLSLDDAEADEIFDIVSQGLSKRYGNLADACRARFDSIKDSLAGRSISESRQQLIGVYLLAEYSFEAAALFNPSIVPAPDQSDCPDGGVSFFMSLRGIGEGHISSVTFRTGTWVPGSAPVIDPTGPHTASPTIESGSDADDAVVRLRWDGIDDVSEAVLFPILPRHKQGIEDARFVRFIDDDGEAYYYATVTAFSGSDISGDLVCAQSLDDFTLHPLTGKAAGNKGMALFPRKIDGRYVMLGRQDNENLWLMRSDDLFVWEEADKLLEPKWPWEFVQIGNCGSPIEIDEGWLVLTHGVGPARAYSIGACLLDKDDPSKVLGRMRSPLLHPSSQERDGYVPNVVYSCGSLVHGRTILLPYGVADSVTRFASGSVDDILAAME